MLAVSDRVEPCNVFSLLPRGLADRYQEKPCGGEMAVVGGTIDIDPESVYVSTRFGNADSDHCTLWAGLVDRHLGGIDIYEVRLLLVLWRIVSSTTGREKAQGLIIKNSLLMRLRQDGEYTAHTTRPQHRQPLRPYQGELTGVYTYIYIVSRGQQYRQHLNTIDVFVSGAPCLAWISCSYSCSCPVGAPMARPSSSIP